MRDVIQSKSAYAVRALFIAILTDGYIDDVKKFFEEFCAQLLDPYIYRKRRELHGTAREPLMSFQNASFC